GLRDGGRHLLVNIRYGTRETALCYGYDACWAHCLPDIHVDCDGFEVETLINIRIAQAGLRIAEVPSFESPRIHGVSNLNPWRDGWRILKTILSERVACRSACAPQPALSAELEQEGGVA